MMEPREHVTSAARCRWLIEHLGMRPGLDFSTVGCTRCWNVIAYCTCEPPLTVTLATPTK